MNHGAITHAAGVHSPPSSRAVSSNTGNPTTASLALPTLALRHHIHLRGTTCAQTMRAARQR
ncbi:hypothetical protein KXJ72_13105 [Comamonas aquatica]|nr:hypothetical protein KXJ72_13105 [Comamonas aquatica]